MRKFSLSTVKSACPFGKVAVLCRSKAASRPQASRRICVAGTVAVVKGVRSGKWWEGERGTFYFMSRKVECPPFFGELVILPSKDATRLTIEIGPQGQAVDISHSRGKSTKSKY